MKTLVVSVHPDDETIGCAGTLLKLKEQGHELYWMIVTDVNQEYGYSKDVILNTNRQIRDVAERYKFKKVVNLGFKPRYIHEQSFNALIEKVSNAFNDIKPETIITINRSDIHTDHQVVAKAIMSCTKPFRYPFIDKVLMYECISETEVSFPLPENIFIPNYYVDITKYIEEKLQIMKIYDTELQDSPQPRNLDNIKSLAKYRGNSVGLHYAEAFCMLRQIER